MFGDAQDKHSVKMGKGSFITDAVWFWRKIMGLKLVAKRTKSPNICMARVRKAIISHHLN